MDKIFCFPHGRGKAFYFAIMVFFCKDSVTKLYGRCSPNGEEKGRGRGSS